MKVILEASGDVESFSSGSRRGGAGGERVFCGRFAGPGPSPSASALSFPNRRSRRPDGGVEVVTAVVGAPAATDPAVKRFCNRFG